MDFKIVGKFTGIETFATGQSIRELRRMTPIYGKGRWRKRKGIGIMQLRYGETRPAELHWYDAKGIGKKGFKIKRYLD